MFTEKCKETRRGIRDAAKELSALNYEALRGYDRVTGSISTQVLNSIERAETHLEQASKELLWVQELPESKLIEVVVSLLGKTEWLHRQSGAGDMAGMSSRNVAKQQAIIQALTEALFQAKGQAGIIEGEAMELVPGATEEYEVHSEIINKEL